MALDASVCASVLIVLGESMVPFYGTFQGFECGGCATDVCFKAANIGIDADIDGSSRWSELVVVLSDAHAHVVLKKSGFGICRQADPTWSESCFKKS